MSKEMHRTITATCGYTGDYSCSWNCNGTQAYTEADAHTARTGHRTIVVETINTIFTRDAANANS